MHIPNLTKILNPQEIRPDNFYYPNTSIMYMRILSNVHETKSLMDTFNHRPPIHPSVLLSTSSLVRGVLLCKDLRWAPKGVRKVKNIEKIINSI